MLIRNATSFQDLQQKKQLQAELLQVQIDNEALLEKRVSDYQNPNKPPPLPPQYKTASELAEDSLYQQRLVIDNLRSLNIDYRVAAAVSQELLQLPDGQGNLVKFNKNFPLIKSDIQKRFDVKLLDNQVIIEYLKEFFDEIDTAIGLNLTGTSSTNFFQTTQPLFAKGVLPSSEDYTALKGLYDTLSANFNLNAQDLQTLDSQFVGLILISPTEDELDFIDTLPSIERQRLNKIVSSLTKKIPSVSFISNAASSIQDIQVIQDPTQQLQQFQQITASLLRSFGSVSDKDQEQLIKLKEKIQQQQQANISTQASLLSIAGAQPINPQGQLRPQVIQENESYVRGKINKLNNQSSRIRISAKATQQVKWVDNQGQQQDTLIYGRDDGRGGVENTFLDQVPTSDGLPPRQDLSNVIFELGKVLEPSFVDASKPVRGQQPPAKVFKGGYKRGVVSTLRCPVFIDGTPVDLTRIARTLDEYLVKARFDVAKIAVAPNNKEIETVLDPNSQMMIPKLNPLQPFGVNYDGDLYKSEAVNQRYTKDELKDIINDKEYNPVVRRRLVEQDTYDPMHIKSQQLIPSQGFGLKSKSPNFNAKRIKVGKGIAVQEELPRYRSFGKYIIHYPHLIEDSVLNLKFPSTGSIPSIKPVKIDDNYKQFIKDILDTNKVNKKHYESLTEQEKNHFLKIARGAKITSLITFITEEKEDEDYKRLELCIGEINAGNDNHNIKKEVKELLKKYVENGKISKLKAADILLQL